MLLAATAALGLVARGGAAEPLPTSGPVPAERLTIEYRAGTFRLLSRASVTKVISPSDELPATNGAVSGFWFEVQTPEGKVKYRRTAPDPLTVYTEVPAPGNESQPERAEAVVSEKVFTVLIPQVPGSNNLVLVSSPPGVAGKALAAQAIARIPLPELNK